MLSGRLLILRLLLYLVLVSLLGLKRGAGYHDGLGLTGVLR